MNTKEWIDNMDFDDVMEYRPIKIIVYTAAGLAIVFAVGYIFKITAHTVRGYNELKSSLNGY